MISFEILFKACPMWILPLANGGPSCKSKRGLPSLSFNLCSYNLFSRHCFCHSASRTGKLPRILNLVLPKLRVSLILINKFLSKKENLALIRTRLTVVPPKLNLKKFHLICVTCKKRLDHSDS